MPTQLFQYRDDFSTRPLEIVVHDHVRGEFSPFFELGGGARETRAHVAVTVAACSKALFEQLHRGRQDQDHDRRGVDRTNLLGPLDFDLEEHVRALRGLGERRAVEVTMKLSPLEERSSLDGLFEGGPVDVEVLIAVLTRPALSRRPAAAQPEVRIKLDKSPREGPLADTAWTDQYDQQRLSGQELETVRRVAWGRDREYDESSRWTHSS